MTRPYSDDLRACVAAAVVGGQTCRAAAALFGVSVSAAAKWSARLRAEGAADAKPMGGTRRAVLAGERHWLLERIAAVPDRTLRAIQAELAARGVVVSLWAVWWFCEAEGITFKKEHPGRRARGNAGRLPLGACGHRQPPAALGTAPGHG